MMGGAFDQSMFDHIDSSTMSDTLKKAFFSVVLELVPYAFSISLEGTLGITIDGKQMMFLHFSDSINKSSEDDAVGATKSLPPHPKRNSTSSKRSFGDALNRTSRVHPKAKSNCYSNGDTKHSLPLSNAHPIQSATEDVLTAQSNQSEYLAVAEACLEFPAEKSTAARRKGRPARYPTDGVTVFRDVTTSHVSSVCPVIGEEETEISSGQLEVLDFSTHGKVESFKRGNAPDCSAATANENPKSFQACSIDDEIEGAPTKARNQQDQTLLRQLLLNNTKSKKAKSSKRRLSGSDDESGKKACVEASSSTSENLKGGSSGLAPQESDASASWTTHRSTASKRTDGKSTDDAGVERRANPDSILCRLLTSGVNIYDTTEVERLRQVSANKQEVAVDWDAGQNIATAGQHDNAVDDVVLTNIKTKWEPCLRTEEFINITPVETTDKTDELIDIAPIETTEDHALGVQSNIQRPVSNSPLGQLSRTGTGPHLRKLPDAVIVVSPQRQANVAEQCLSIVKKERDDSVDVRRTLHVSSGVKFPNGAQTKENLYQTCSAKSSDFGK